MGATVKANDQEQSENVFKRMYKKVFNQKMTWDPDQPSVQAMRNRPSGHRPGKSMRRKQRDKVREERGY